MEEHEMLDQSIHDMVNNMREETELSASLVEAGQSIFRSQMRDAFKWEAGARDYWDTLEKCWRDMTGNQPIPTKYRTNKSVILKAYSHSGELAAWYEGDGLMGKSAIQNSFSKGALLTAEGGMRQIIRIIDKVKHDSGEAEQEALINSITHYCKGGMS